MTTALMCRADGCDQESRTAWINTLKLAARGHEQLPICRDHLDVLADRGHVSFTPHPGPTSRPSLIARALATLGR